MNKLIRTILLLLTMTVAISACEMESESNQQPQTDKQEESQPSQPEREQAFIKAVHYFSSSWPVTFWDDFEKSHVEADFAQIKSDGFNTIILVIPWMGFEIGFEDREPEPSHLYERLEWLLTKIDESGLDYGVRVSFPYSFDPAVGFNSNALCKEIFVDVEMRNQWLQYIQRVTHVIDKKRDSFKFAFFSWEDFFCPYVSFPAMDLETRLDIAESTGYQKWLIKYYPKQLIERSYGRSFETMDLVPVPVRESSAFWLFLRFVDQFMIDQMLLPGREILPELAMEVRIDKDLIKDGEDSWWAEHDLGLWDDQLRGTYWGAYSGAKNQGELLTANEALRNFEYMLNEVSDNGKNVNHFVEQFNFVDNTPRFAGHHAQIDVPEIPSFLEGAAKLLKAKSKGYGLWAYRDYPDSAIYNSSFELGARGWGFKNNVNITTNVDGDLALHMQTGAEISQTFNPYERFGGLTPSTQVTFCANFVRRDDSARVTLALNGAKMATIQVTETSRQCAVMDSQPFKQLKTTFSVSSDSEIELDDIQLYLFEQKLNVYDINGQPGPLRELIVRFNNEWLDDDT